MALHTHDEEAGRARRLLAPEPDAAIEQTREPGERLHVDLGAALMGRADFRLARNPEQDSKLPYLLGPRSKAGWC